MEVDVVIASQGSEPKRTLHLADGILTIGRSPRCTIMLDKRLVSAAGTRNRSQRVHDAGTRFVDQRDDGGDPARPKRRGRRTEGGPDSGRRVHVLDSREGRRALHEPATPGSARSVSRANPRNRPRARCQDGCPGAGPSRSTTSRSAPGRHADQRSARRRSRTGEASERRAPSSRPRPHGSSRSREGSRGVTSDRDSASVALRQCIVSPGIRPRMEPSRRSVAAPEGAECLRRVVRRLKSAFRRHQPRCS